VAEGAFVDAGFLPRYRRVSEGRNVWIDDPDTQMLGVDCSQHCGGLREAGNGEFQRFLNIACGSASELEYHFLLARDLAFLSEADYQKLNHGVVEVKRMLASLARKVEAERFAS
jgi:hypothetical protein